MSITSVRKNYFYRALSFLIAFNFLVGSIFPSTARAQFITPTNVAIQTGVAFTPAMIKGINIYPDNPLKFDFMIDRGETHLSPDEFKTESMKLIKYFLASLTVPEDQTWVNLSPYEKDRIIPNEFGSTDMGQEMLAQDFLLKQLTASLLNPDSEIGKKFWERVYSQTQAKFGTTDIPVNTFNKIWILPEKAFVYEHDKGAFVVNSHLKVMLEEDYLALEQNKNNSNNGIGIDPNHIEKLDQTSTQMVREILIPEIEREVNEGKTFANLRQIFNSMILATWYKQALKESILGKAYADQNKIKGIESSDRDVKEKIYNQYVEAFKKGAYDAIKEDYDPNSQQVVSRKYLTGGVTAGELHTIAAGVNAAMISEPQKNALDAAMKSSDEISNVTMEINGGQATDAAMATGIRRDADGFPNEKPRYLENYRKGRSKVPRSLISTMYSLDWPINMKSETYIHSFPGQIFKLRMYGQMPDLSAGPRIGVVVKVFKRQKVRSIISGRVELVVMDTGRRRNEFDRVLIRSDNGLSISYPMLRKLKVREGEHVEVGQEIGETSYYSGEQYGDRYYPLSGTPIDKELFQPRATGGDVFKFYIYYIPPGQSVDDAFAGNKVPLELNPLLFLKPLYDIPADAAMVAERVIGNAIREIKESKPDRVADLTRILRDLIAELKVGDKALVKMQFPGGAEGVQLWRGQEKVSLDSDSSKLQREMRTQVIQAIADATVGKGLKVHRQIIKDGRSGDDIITGIGVYGFIKSVDRDEYRRNVIRVLSLAINDAVSLSEKEAEIQKLSSRLAEILQQIQARASAERANITMLKSEEEQEIIASIEELGNAAASLDPENDSRQKAVESIYKFLKIWVNRPAPYLPSLEIKRAVQKSFYMLVPASSYDIGSTLDILDGLDYEYASFKRAVQREDRGWIHDETRNLMTSVILAGVSDPAGRSSGELKGTTVEILREMLSNKDVKDILREVVQAAFDHVQKPSTFRVSLTPSLTDAAILAQARMPTTMQEFYRTVEMVVGLEYEEENAVGIKSIKNERWLGDLGNYLLRVQTLENNIAEEAERITAWLNDRAATDAALTATNGGIDFNPKALEMNIKRDGKGIPLPVSQQPIEQFMQLQEFVPVIINIAPIQNLPALLGLKEEEEEVQLTKGS